jgi:DHA1 family tetracycline resistance protein-like MFS transporter
MLSIVLGSLAPRRSRQVQSGAVGLAGSGVMLGLAVGPALGGVLMRLGPTAPFRAAAVLALLVAATVVARPEWLSASIESDGSPPARRSGFSVANLKPLAASPRLLVPMVLTFVERFTVGCFVVTFSLYAHGVRHLSDAETALHYSLFLLPFAIATYPLARSTDHWSRAWLMGAGGILYGAAFCSFGWVSGTELASALVIAGLASAMVYGPSLCSVASVGRDAGRATSMAMFHAAGCLGMLLGPAVAGAVTAVMNHAGFAIHARYTAVFTIAGTVQLLCILVLRTPLAKLRAGELAGSETHDAPTQASPSFSAD